MEEIKSIPDFAFQSLGLAFGLVGALNRQVYARAIEKLGINDAQLFILVALENLGPQVQAHLSNHLKIDKATMVSLVNGLEQKNFVQRLPHPNDRRAVLVHLTSEGREMMFQGFKLSEQFTQQLFEGISISDQEIMLENLRQVTLNLVGMGAALK